METASPDPAQMSFLHANLLDQLNPRHPLYSTRGKPAKPIRLMVGLSMLKHPRKGVGVI